MARLFSPANQPYTGRGIAPDSVTPDGEPTFARANEWLREQIKPAAMTMASATMPPQ